MSSSHVLLLMPIHEIPSSLARLKKEHPGLKITYINVGDFQRGHSVEASILADADYLVTLSTLPSPAALPKLRLIHFISAGVDDKLDNPLIQETNVPITSSAGVSPPAIAEWFTTMLLHFTLDVKNLLAAQERHDFNTLGGPWLQRKTLQGQRLGILGYGSIGRQIARVATAFGMEVLVQTATEKKTTESKRLTTYTIPGTGDIEGRLPSQWFSGTDKASLHKFLAQGLDVIVVCTPLTDKTRHSIGREEFEVLAKHSTYGPYLFNISRGAVLRQTELETALEEGILKGAALDVTEPEPLPSDHTLWTAKNCFVTPHMSGANQQMIDTVMDIFCENLNRMADGKPLLNEIQRNRSY